MIRINLLPRERAQRRPLGTPVLFAIVIGVLLPVVVGTTLWLSARNAAVRAEVARVNQQIADIRPKVARVEELRRQVELARRKSDLLKSLEASRVPWDIILEELRVVLPQDVWLTQVEMQEAGNMTFNGYGLTYTSVARFMVSLEGSELFRNIDMLSSQTQTVGNRPVVSFSLTGQFVQVRKEANVR